ncbi:hypothetical protein CBR_g36325 [Chara braunii]|uniref:AB hydrolase-1 domain-containing protein n=1 Tax=Chara braunii TaxID=69332 RepID=A0A388LKE6_CHABU|nr:hypothetical protein CBR_g36325 [Chara braunii]|eukprot:GBG82794.1 hypothetical protein CBR_g36325 [Chara braunii]
MDKTFTELHNVNILGSGQETIVLGHGFGSDQTCWRHLVPHLVKHYRVVLFDMVGAGKSDFSYFSFSRHGTLHGFADDLLNILDELEIDSCIYVGHSVSGMVGMLASIEQPQLFQRIVAMMSSPRYLDEPASGYIGGFCQDDLNQLFQAMQQNFFAWVSGFAPLAIDGDVESEAVQEFSRTLFSMRPDIALATAKAIFQSDCRSVLPLVTCPVHLLHSTKDYAVPGYVGHYMQAKLYNSASLHMEFMPTYGHLPHIKMPGVVNPYLLRHIWMKYDEEKGQEVQGRVPHRQFGADDVAADHH